MRPAQNGLRGATAAVAAALLLTSWARAAACAQFASFRVTGDRVTTPLEGLTGDAARGRRVVLDRNAGNCLICHAVPEPAERFMGDVGPDLTGVGSRLDQGQLRLRVIDSSRVNPGTVMPPYYRLEGLVRVGEPWRGKPVLTSGQVEDVVAYLASLTAAK